MTRMSLEKVELEARRAVTRDGITEALMGMMLLVYGVALFFAPPLALLAVLLPFPLTWTGRFLKGRYVYPRIGYAKVAKGERPFRGILIVAAMFLVCLLGALGVFSWILGFDEGSGLWLSHFVPAFASCLMAIGPWTVGQTYRLARWYVCAALFVAGGIALPLLGIATGYDAISLEAMVIGGLALIYGIGLFAIFVHRVPVSAGGNRDAAE